MKYFILIVTLSLLALIGCTDNSELPVGPTSDNYHIEKQTVAPNPSSQPVMHYELIPLPSKAPEWQDSVFTVSQDIDGSIGGEIILSKFYISAGGKVIAILADLTVPAGAFEGNKTITVTVDNDYAAVHFYPSMTFAKPLKLTQSFTGLDLSNYHTGTIDFVFIDDNGVVETIRDNGVQINLPQGFVRVLNAKLPHFSRYAWTRGPVTRSKIMTFMPAE